MIVKKIGEVKNSVLLEWHVGSTVFRGYLPTKLYRDGEEVPESALQKAVMYGLPYERILTSISITSSEMANEFRKRGLWTSADIKARPQEVSAALIACAHASSAKIQTAVRDYETKEEL